MIKFVVCQDNIKALCCLPISKVTSHFKGKGQSMYSINNNNIVFINVAMYLKNK